MGLYTVDSQKTYLGKTAGGWLKNAEVAQMRAGNWEIWIPELSAIAMLCDDGDLTFDHDDRRIVLTTSGRAYRRAEKLSAKVWERYKELYEDEWTGEFMHFEEVE